MSSADVAGVLCLIGGLTLLLDLGGLRQSLVRYWVGEEEKAPDFMTRTAGTFDPEVNYRQKRSMAWGLTIALLVSSLVLLLLVE